MNFKLIFLILFFSLSANISHSQNGRTQNEAKELSEEIYKRLMLGNSFSTIARLYSEDTTNTKGGEYGWLKKGVFSKEFDQVVFSLSVNEISHPFSTKKGYYIVNVLEKKDEEIRIKLIQIPFSH